MALLRSPAALSAAMLVMVLLSTCTEARWSGEGTAYGGAGQRGTGACGMRQNLGKYEVYYASLNSHQYSPRFCGKCVRIRGQRGSVVAMVVDMCVGCRRGDVDMSSDALRRATGYTWDRKPITWSFTNC